MAGLGSRQLKREPFNIGMTRIQLDELAERCAAVCEAPREEGRLRRSEALLNPALPRALLEPGPALHRNERPIMNTGGDRRRGIVECGHTAAACKTSSGEL